MKFVDYHVHSNHSCDGKATVFEMCKKAIEMEIVEIGFSDHMDFEPEDPGFGFFNYADYTSEIKSAQENAGHLNGDIRNPQIQPFGLCPVNGLSNSLHKIHHAEGGHEEHDGWAGHKGFEDNKHDHIGPDGHDSDCANKGKPEWEVHILRQKTHKDECCKKAHGPLGHVKDL